MKFHIITLFPHILDSYISDSIIKRARAAGHIDIQFYNPRDFAENKHNKVDDKPYGGGPGMVLQAEPILRAYDAAKGRKRNITTLITAADGEQFSNTVAKSFAEAGHDIIIICGHYEGVDERVVEATNARKMSIGPYVLTGGELPAMIIAEATARQLPGVLGNIESIEENRISSHQSYTRPETLTYKKKKYSVPEVLLSGDHKKIDAWREGS